MEEPLQRVLIKIDQRKRNIIQNIGYYDFFTEEIFLGYPWWIKDKHLETDIEKVIEHETIHYVLQERISYDASDKLDNINISHIRLGFDRKMIIPRKCAKIEIRA